MKILAIEKEINGVSWENSQTVLEEEAKHVYELQINDKLREIYFNEDKCAVLVFETESMEEAQKIVAELPLVKEGYIKFDLMSLKPYDGLSRLLK
jgi:muconolactone delta-isomerase